MTDDLTTRIAELRRLHEAATGGTWFWQPGDHPPYAIWSALTVTAQVDRTDDAHLIVALRNALPELLDAAEEAERLRGEVETLRSDRNTAYTRLANIERDLAGALQRATNADTNRATIEHLRAEVARLEKVLEAWREGA